MYEYYPFWYSVYNPFWLLLRTCRFDNICIVYGLVVCRLRPGARRTLQSVWPLSRCYVQRDHSSRSPPPVLRTAPFSPECARDSSGECLPVTSGRHHRCISLDRVSMPRCVTLVHFWCTSIMPGNTPLFSFTHTHTHLYFYIWINAHSHTRTLIQTRPLSEASSNSCTRPLIQFLHSKLPFYNS